MASKANPPFLIWIYDGRNERHLSDIHLARGIEIRAFDYGIVAAAAPIGPPILAADCAFPVELRALV